jgi:hypothetical protein
MNQQPVPAKAGQKGQQGGLVESEMGDSVAPQAEEKREGEHEKKGGARRMGFEPMPRQEPRFTLAP